MALAITWTDSADGTGGTVTVAGSDAATVTVYKMAVDATGLTTPTFTSAGTRSGDGTVSVSLSAGYYWIYASGTVSGSPAISNLVYAYATEDTDALISRCVDALAARLAGLTMTTGSGVSVPNERIYKRIVPEPDATVEFPCILLTHEGNRESQDGTTTGKDDIGYPVNVLVCDRHGADFVTKRKTWMKWRQQVFRALRNQRLAGVTESLIVRMEPLTMFDPKLPSYQHVILGFVARCVCRETRGT